MERVDAGPNTGKMQEKLDELRKQIRILEWDKNLNQINFSRIKKLKELKTELESLEKPVQDIILT